MIKLRKVPMEQFFKLLGNIFNETAPKPIQAHQDKLGLQASCINCVYFADNAVKSQDGKTIEAETCRKFNSKPPAHVIALSCEAWEDVDDIPF